MIGTRLLLSELQHARAAQRTGDLRCRFLVCWLMWDVPISPEEVFHGRGFMRVW